MSPEQREDPENVSYPSDIYSLGIIAYELIVGRITQSQIHLSLLPKGVQKIIARALQPKPDDRYRDVVDFISDLSQYLHSPFLDKESRCQDMLIDAYDKLKEKSSSWLRPKAPNWIGYEVQISYDPFPFFPRLFWEFFENDIHFGFILFEQVENPLSGLIALSWIKGILESNKELVDHPEKLAHFLNQKLIRCPDTEPFLYASLLIHKKTNYAQFLSAGGPELIRLAKEGSLALAGDLLPLGIEDSFPFKSSVLPLKEQEILLIHPGEKNREEFL